MFRSCQAIQGFWIAVSWPGSSGASDRLIVSHSIISVSMDEYTRRPQGEVVYKCTLANLVGVEVR